MLPRKSSLAVTYYDPEAEPVPEPTPEPEIQLEPPKRRGRPPGSKSKPKTPTKQKRNIPWFSVWRVIFWSAAAAISVVSLYFGVQGLLGNGAAHVVLAVSVLAAAYLLDRDWKKMRKR